MTSDAARHPLADGRTTAAALVRALRGERAARTPVVFTGQSLRAHGGVLPELDTWLDPRTAAARTVAPVGELGVDAAVLCTHPALPMLLAGVPIELAPGRRPSVEAPIRTGSDVLRLRPLDPERLEPIRQAVIGAVTELGTTPLIAVAWAPFTLAAHLVDGDASPDLLETRSMMYRDPHAWAALLNWCADVAGESLRVQMLAGASAVELSDPLIGVLSRNDYFKRALPHTQRVFSHLRGLDVPIIHTGSGSGEILDLMARSGADAVGIDWRIPLDTATERIGPAMTLKGNLDPALLVAPDRVLAAHVVDVLERGRSARAQILDLGGPLPAGTSTDVLRRIVELVRDAGM